MIRGKTFALVFAWPLLLMMALALMCLSPATALADAGNADLSAADALATQADGATASGTWGTCPWTIDAEGTLTINPGVGELQDGKYKSPWGSYNASIKKVVFATGADGSKVVAPENLQYLFYMMKLTSADLRGLNASNVKSLENVFAGCTALKSVDVTGLNTSNVTSIAGLFHECSSLASVTGFESLDLSNATSLRYTFYNCSSLPAFDLSCLSGASITDADSAFEDCSSAVSIDLSGVDTTNMTSAENMFYNCSALTTVYVGDKWSVASLYENRTTRMFAGCTKIVGEKGTTYNPSYTKSERAHVDGGESNPGYLTYKKAVEKKSLAKATITLSATDFAYNGAAQKPTVKSVVLDGATLAENTDFTVAYSDANPTDAGAYTVTVTGTGNYKDTATAPFAIAAKSLAAATVELSPTSYVYNGTAREPGVTVTLDGAQLKRDADYAVAYADNTAVGTATATVTGQGNYKDSVKATFTITAAPEPGPGPGPEPDPDKGQVMRRLYNPYSYEHFYTSDADELAGLVELGWVDEGEGWTAPTTSETPVFRLYNPYNGGDHHYTTDAAERDALVAAGWQDEDVGWYSAADTGTPVYREYNPYELVRNHNYTRDKDEHDGLVSIGWHDEDIAWYGL